MQRALLILGAILAGVLALLWLTGGLAALQATILASQREIQSTLADAVRQIKRGAPAANAALLAVCFTYGVLHAAGPGHGKVVIGGYGMGRRVPLVSLSLISFAASLAQAGVAVAFVYASVALLGWTRAQAHGVADELMAPIGTAAICGVGLWLIWRGLRSLRRQFAEKAQSRHVHGEHCSHAHGPTVGDMDCLTHWRDVAVLITGIALRPCTGALFLLILTWQLGIGASGVAGAFAMGLGTSVITIGVAILSVWSREGALASLPTQAVARALPWFELIAGGLVVVIALSLFVSVP
jgi:nickel/cobalt exporter